MIWWKHKHLQNTKDHMKYMYSIKRAGMLFASDSLWGYSPRWKCNEEITMIQEKYIIRRYCKYCEIIKFRGIQFSWIVGFLLIHKDVISWMHAWVFSFSRKIYSCIISFFVEDVNSWVKAIHEYHENWVIANSNDFTVQYDCTCTANLHVNPHPTLTVTTKAYDY